MKANYSHCGLVRLMEPRLDFCLVQSKVGETQKVQMTVKTLDCLSVTPSVHESDIFLVHCRSACWTIRRHLGWSLGGRWGSQIIGKAAK